MVTRRASWWWYLNHMKRLVHIKIILLRRRRLRRDLIDNSKIFFCCSTQRILYPSHIDWVMGQPPNLAKSTVRTTLQQNLFAIRVANLWNHLPFEAVMAPSTAWFKLRLIYTCIYLTEFFCPHKHICDVCYPSWVKTDCSCHCFCLCILTPISRDILYTHLGHWTCLGSRPICSLYRW